MENKPSLFGQKNASRDYSNKEYWGKNQFNSSFPASLVAYMWDKKISPVYLKIDKKKSIKHDYISGEELFGIDPLSDSAYYDFEASYNPYERYYYSNQKKEEHIDLVMEDLSTNKPVRGLEIKLTALPDDTTVRLTEDKYSCEIVVRPPSICFLACSICQHYDSARGKAKLKKLLSNIPKVYDWSDVQKVAPHYKEIENAVMNVAVDMASYQTPLIVQPIWKTDGKLLKLSENCLDVFVWSNLSILLMCCSGDKELQKKKINRCQRTIIWVYLMLLDFVQYDKFDYTKIVTDNSYDIKNDKAFSLSGLRTHQFLNCNELLCPRIKKSEIKNIILGGGQEFLSPERRFDAAIVNSPNLFDN